MNKKPVIALLAGVAGGKSTVAKMLAERGAMVIDADVVGHEILREPEVRDRIVHEFGSSILGDDHEIDRKKLGRVVFSDEKRLNTLNDLTHPHIRQRISDRITEGQNNPDIPAVVLDISLLLESGAYNGQWTCLVFVDSPEHARVNRGIEKRGWDKDEINRRQQHQMSVDEKRKRADVILNNDSTLKDLETQVQALWKQLIR